MIVSTAAERPFSKVDRVGVAIAGDDDQRHTGFLYRLDGGPPTLLHLATHHVLLRRVEGERYGPDETYLWADLAEVDEENKRFLVGLLSVVGGPDPKIPYGFDAEGIEFDPQTGHLKPPPPGKGVTCATFLLTVLQAAHEEVIDPTGWPADRPGDAEWRDRIIREHIEARAPEHAEAIRQDPSCVRFRPEEVVGAIATDGWPHKFDSAEALGLNVLQDLAAAGFVKRLPVTEVGGETSTKAAGGSEVE